MAIEQPISVRDAARRLGVSDAAIRQQIAAGRLRAARIGRDWLLDPVTVERAARQRSGSGRPVSPAMAWAVLLLASGDSEAAVEVAAKPRYASRARQWLKDHSLRDEAVRLRKRANREEFAAHPAELPRLLRRADVLATGISAADLVGVVGGSTDIEVYAPDHQREQILGEHALESGPGQVLLRWVPDELWPLLSRGSERRAPRAAILVDLLEHDDPRARREAALALAP